MKGINLQYCRYVFVYKCNACFVGYFLFFVKYEGFSLEHKVYDMKSLFCKAVESDTKQSFICPNNADKLY
jgi:hypothetical protein